MAASVIAKSNVSRGQRRIGLRHLRRAQVLSAQKPVRWAGGDGGKKRAMWIGPLVTRATVEKDRSRRDQGDQLVRVHRQIVPMSGVFAEIDGKPMR